MKVGPRSLGSLFNIQLPYLADFLFRLLSVFPKQQPNELLTISTEVILFENWDPKGKLAKPEYISTLEATCILSLADNGLGIVSLVLKTVSFL